MTDFSMEWQYAWGGPLGRCRFKSKPEDFRVDEELPFKPDGEGEHLYLLVKKVGHNTDWVADQLARHAKVIRSQVSYAGRKDRQAVAYQWFCISLPGLPNPDWRGFESETISIVKQIRHRRKLRTGSLKSNHFTITLRDLDVDPAELEQKLTLVASKGVPNYYGQQRFGTDNRNIIKALAFFDGQFNISRNKRSIYLSAARSWIFNSVLSQRVKQGNWSSWLDGDVFGFSDNNSLIFDDVDESLKQRVNNNELSATGPLWGSGALQSKADCFRLEENDSSQHVDLCKGLEKAGLKHERKVLKLLPEEMKWSWLAENCLLVSFRLPKGCFATSLLRELVLCDQEDG